MTQKANDFGGPCTDDEGIIRVDGDVGRCMSEGDLCPDDIDCMGGFTECDSSCNKYVASSLTHS